MFKKFFLVLTLCLGIFGSMAFASEIDSKDLSLDGNSYYISYNAAAGQVWLYTFNDYEITTRSGKNVFLFSEGIHYVQFSSDTDFVSQGSVYNKYFEGTSSYYSSNCPDFVSFVNSEGGSIESIDVVPPVISPAVEEAIQGITPQLSNQLQEYLPTGVILLSLVLGVSLVPRLVRLFL